MDANGFITSGLFYLSSPTRPLSLSLSPRVVSLLLCLDTRQEKNTEARRQPVSADVSGGGKVTGRPAVITGDGDGDEISCPKMFYTLVFLRMCEVSPLGRQPQLSIYFWLLPFKAGIWSTAIPSCL